MEELDKFQIVGDTFCLPGKVKNVQMLSGGNINTTYKVTYEGGKSYIFQKVNTYVFKDPVAVMKNIDYVTEHVRSKNLLSLHFHHTKDRLNYATFDNGSFWRVINYIDSITFDSCNDLEIVKKLGKAIGDFQVKVSDIDCSRLVETIPDFHNTKKRLDTLFLHDNDSEEMRYFKEVADEASKVSIMFSNGELPKKVTHNDTKANNVLFDKKGKEPLVVIDLDTIMPGLGLNDFADAARFICNDAREDEDPDFAHFNLNKFKAFAKGYLSSTKNILTDKEKESIYLSIFGITIELASRFFDDYLNGNVYFKCNYPEHNLIRARNQIALAKDIKKKENDIKSILEKLLK